MEVVRAITSCASTFAVAVGGLVLTKPFLTPGVSDAIPMSPATVKKKRL